MPGSVAESHVEDILGPPTQRRSFAADRSRTLFRNRNYLTGMMLRNKKARQARGQGEG